MLQVSVGTSGFSKDTYDKVVERVLRLQDEKDSFSETTRKLQEEVMALKEENAMLRIEAARHEERAKVLQEILSQTSSAKKK